MSGIRNSLLKSFPGSGNTWLRYLIQKTTGFVTGSIHNSKILVKNGFPGEFISNGSAIVVKSHLQALPYIKSGENRYKRQQDFSHPISIVSERWRNVFLDIFFKIQFFCKIAKCTTLHVD